MIPVSDLEIDDRPPSWIGRRIYVGNVPKSCTFSEVQNLFEQFGEITHLTMPLKEKKSKKMNSFGSVDLFRGFAFVTFSTKQAAANAIREPLYLAGAKLLAEIALPQLKGGKSKKN